MVLKRIALFAAVVALLMVLAGCEEAGTSVPAPPQLRFYNNTASLEYYNYGDDLGNNTADLKGTWVSVSPGSTSPYQDVTAGSYTMYYDSDSDHSSFSLFSSTTWNLEAGKKYILTSNGSTYSVREE